MSQAIAHSPQPFTSWPPKIMRRIIGMVSPELKPRGGELASFNRAICSAFSEMSVAAKEQALEIARHCYGKEESWMGQLGGWPAWYTHKRRRIMNELVPSEDRRTITEKFAYELPPESSLHIGEWGVWELKVVKSDGDFEVHESGEINRGEISKIDE